jgi:hypothetical protein
VVSSVISVGVVCSLVLAAPASGAVAGAPLAGEQPEATPVSFWPMIDGDTSDVIGDHDLALTGTQDTDYCWNDDRFGFPESALELDGSGRAYASTAGRVVITDESFTVEAWVGLRSLTDHHQTVLSQAGHGWPAVQLQATPDGRWRFTVPTGHPRSGLGTAQTDPRAVDVGIWTHLTGVYDRAADEVRLYVNGELAATGDAGPVPWRAHGSFYIGVAGTARGHTSQPFHGIITPVGVWTSTLDPARIRDRGFGGGMLPVRESCSP